MLVSNFIKQNEYAVNKKLKSVKQMKEKCSLDRLPLGVTGIVEQVNCNENIKNRIFDFGIMKDSLVVPLFSSPFGDPCAYLVKNAVVALRNNDCKNIIVTPV